MIVIRNGKQIVRCDGCSKAPENLDQFDQFYISWPAGYHLITREPLIKYLTMPHAPTMPVTLHTCPACAKRIRRALKNNMIHALPEGPLKKYLLGIMDRAENKFRAFQIHFLKDSRIGQA